MTTREPRSVPTLRSDRISRRIAREIDARLAYYAGHRREIDLRLEELAREWPAERLLEANLSVAAILSLVFGASTTRSRLWLLVPAVLSGFLLQQACTSSSAPFRLLRQIGVRTEHEILYERAALKALRGDFAQLDFGERTSRDEEAHAVN